jgi:uracil-DNA glycosylase
VLQAELEAPYVHQLRDFLKSEYNQQKVIFPAGQHIFKAFELTPFDLTRVVILGQDPYHGPNQAHGLSFSVPVGVRKPPSLVNIFSELQADLGITPPSHGCLEHWAKQGVLLLNSVLTVELGQAASHQGRGWERFTDEVITRVNAKIQPVVFVLWGKYAQQKGKVIDRNRHLVIESVHPSPLSAYRGFFGSKPFSSINRFLQQHDLEPINWKIPEMC